MHELGDLYAPTVYMRHPLYWLHKGHRSLLCHEPPVKGWMLSLLRHCLGHMLAPQRQRAC